MTNYAVGRRPRSADPHSTLRLTAVTAVTAGVVLLAAAAFVLSYPGIRKVALQAGVSPDLAKLYPVIFDAMLVVAGAAAMSLRGAAWWSRFYTWACLILLLVAVAIGDAVHATGTALPERATRAAVAITPWVLLLLAFGLLLTMLSHFRKTRATVKARQEARAAAAGDAGTGGQPAEANGTAPSRAPVTWTTPGMAGVAAGVMGAAAGTAGAATAVEEHPPPPPRFGLDFWLGPRTSSTPAVEGPHESAVTGPTDDASHSDPVSYGEETGYVHPDSYRDEGEDSPPSDSGAGADTGSGHLGQDPAGEGAHGPQDGSATSNGAGGRAANADAAARAGQASKADAGAQAARADAGEHASQADAASHAGQPDAGAQAAPAGGVSEASPAGAQTQPGQTEAGPQAPPADTASQAPPAGAAPPVGQADAESDGMPQPGGKPESAGEDAPAGKGTMDGAAGEPVAANGPVLERLRSSPTRPE